MRYEHCVTQNFEDYASGRVLYHRPGLTNFPARLGLEIFGRCLAHCPHLAKVCVYDPCCGGGYWLTLLGLAQRDRIACLMGSDIDAAALEVARLNLGLLDPAGMKARVDELAARYALYGNPAHDAARRSAQRLLDNLDNETPQVRLFERDILGPHAFQGLALCPDIVLADLPYGNRVAWADGADNTRADDSANAAVDRMLKQLRPVLAPGAVVALCMDKGQRVSAPDYRRLERQSVGKRRFVLLTPS